MSEEKNASLNQNLNKNFFFFTIFFISMKRSMISMSRLLFFQSVSFFL